MICVEGTVEWVPMGAGGWELVTRDGQRYTLICAKDTFSTGEWVVVEGEKQAAFGFMMRGHPTIEVRTITRKT